MPECLIVEAALIFGMAQSALTLWSMGVNQSSVGVQKSNAIINLHLASGKIQVGFGPQSLPANPMQSAAGKSRPIRHVARLPQRGRSAASSMLRIIHAAIAGQHMGQPADFSPAHRIGLTG